MPFAPAGVATITVPTPATRAGTTVITSEDGYGADPPGTYAPTDASGEAVVGNPAGQEGLGALLQGYVENSNVNVVEEFISMIVSQRAYEANTKVVRAADEMYQQVNNVAR